VASVGCFVTVLRKLFLRSYQAVQAVLESHQATWQSLPAFAQAVDEFTALIPEINDLAQTQASRTGFADEKAFALEGMGNATFEVVAAVLAYASVAEDHELAGRVDFSRSAITGGRESEAVARCRDILAAATANVDSLADYGVNQAKLNALKKKIDSFEAVQANPRKQVVTSSAATKSLPEQFRSADSILSRRLDGLVFQFKGTTPDFFNQYISARSIVDSPGGRKAGAEAPNANGGNGGGTPAPAPTPTANS
jgi:hypothetical protein